MKVVEVIDGLLTDATIAPRLMSFVGELGHTPVRAKDTPGFIVNHAGRAYVTEALRCCRKTWRTFPRSTRSCATPPDSGWAV
jgi:3-hydroxybutyryl-CoA dehydrogenase